MARLTHNDRQNFLRAVFEDVPKSRVRDEVQKMVCEDAIAKLPDNLREVARSDRKDYLALGRIQIPSTLMYFIVMVPNARYNLVLDNPSLYKKVIDMVKEDDDVQHEVARVRGTLHTELSTITTDTALKERYPDLAKYLPETLGGTKNVPATNDVMVGLKAAGFPKKS